MRKYDRVRLMSRPMNMSRPIGYDYEGRMMDYSRSYRGARQDMRQDQSGIEPGRAYPNERAARMTMPHAGKTGPMSRYMPQEYGMPYELADQWVHAMRRSDGGRGPKYSFEDAERIMQENQIECDPVEFYAAINAVYSDYGKVAKKFGVTHDEFWACMAEAFICDEDAVEDKLMTYLECVVDEV